MKHLAEFFVCLVFVCALFVSIKAQSSSAKFRSITGQFEIELPQTYTDLKALSSLQVGEQKFALNVYKWDTQGGKFAVSYADGDIDLEANPEQFFSGFRKTYLSKQGVTKPIKDAAMKLDNRPGLELIGEANDTRLITRIFLAKNRLYFLTLSISGEERKLEAVAEKVLSTFRLLSAEELSNERARLIAGFEPETLPQEPFSGKAISDAKDNGLKSNVKQIITEEEKFYGENLFGNRIPVSVEDFNERGYFVKSVNFENGLPGIITNYGYSDGERAANQAFKFYRSTPILIEDGKWRFFKPDETYTQNYKFTYKYNSAGQLEEKKTVNKIPEKTKERAVYKYKDGKIEISVFDSKNDLVTKNIAKLDEKNNAIEESYSTYKQTSSGSTLTMPSAKTSAERNTIERGGTPGNGNDMISNRSSSINPNVNSSRPDTSISVSSSNSKKGEEFKYSYTYEFDSHGNWIKRVTAQVTKKDGKTVSTPIKVTYRTIAYY